jgi:hypothetical protein
VCKCKRAVILTQNRGSECDAMISLIAHAAVLYKSCKVYITGPVRILDLDQSKAFF